MPTGSTSLAALLFGRSWDRAQRMLLGAVVVSIGLGVVGTVIPLGAIVVVRSDTAGVFVVFVLLCTAVVTAYYNVGYVIVVVIQALLLVGLFTSGGIATFPGANTATYLRLMLWFSVEIALISGAVGYAVATVLQTVRPP